MALLSPAIDSYDIFFISQKPDFKKKKGQTWWNENITLLGTPGSLNDNPNLLYG